jgi:hypothetical protein
MAYQWKCNRDEDIIISNSQSKLQSQPVAILRHILSVQLYTLRQQAVKTRELLQIVAVFLFMKILYLFLILTQYIDRNRTEGKP